MPNLDEDKVKKFQKSFKGAFGSGDKAKDKEDASTGHDGTDAYDTGDHSEYLAGK